MTQPINPRTLPGRILTWLQTHPEGITTDGVHLQFSCASVASARCAVSRLKQLGKVSDVQDGSGKSHLKRRIFALEHAPSAATGVRPAPHATTIAKALAPKPLREITVKHTIAPVFVDMRFRVANPTPMFSAMAQGSYLPSDTVLSRAYGERE